MYNKKKRQRNRYRSARMDYYYGRVKLELNHISLYAEKISQPILLNIFRDILFLI